MKIIEYMTEMPHTIGPDISLTKAEEMMAKFHCRHLPVLEGGHLVGILSERDMNLYLAHNKDSVVREAMVEEPLIVDPEEELKSVAQKMLNMKVGSAIIRAKAGKPWGIFTGSDALKVIVDKLN